MKTSATPDMMQAMVDLSAMVFAATSPEDALQSLALALGVQTVSLVRHDIMADTKTVLAESDVAPSARPYGGDFEQSPFKHCVILNQTKDHQDVLVIQHRRGQITADQRSAIDTHGPYLETLWASRSDSFERALTVDKTPATQSVLHPDNPYGLTPTEFRVCRLIAAGHRPATMAHVTNTSMATIRTHLRSIYTKTGLDGMMGVLRNIQAHGDNQKMAG